MRIAIFGGTFDPIHKAHLAIAREAMRRLRLSRILFVPAGRPSHKSRSPFASFEHRYRMVEIACVREPRFVPSRLEAGEETSYSISTIERVRATLKARDRLFFVIGADAFAEVRTWRCWQDVVRAVEFIVLSRPGFEYEAPDGVVLHRLNALRLAASSTQIRRQLAAGDPKVAVPRAVLRYIHEHGLYGAGGRA